MPLPEVCVPAAVSTRRTHRLMLRQPTSYLAFFATTAVSPVTFAAGTADQVPGAPEPLSSASSKKTVNLLLVVMVSPVLSTNTVNPTALLPSRSTARPLVLAVTVALARASTRSRDVIASRMAAFPFVCAGSGGLHELESLEVHHVATDPAAGVELHERLGRVRVTLRGDTEPVDDLVGRADVAEDGAERVGRHRRHVRRHAQRVAAQGRLQAARARHQHVLEDEGVVAVLHQHDLADGGALLGFKWSSQHLCAPIS